MPSHLRNTKFADLEQSECAQAEQSDGAQQPELNACATRLLAAVSEGHW